MPPLPRRAFLGLPAALALGSLGCRAAPPPPRGAPSAAPPAPTPSLPPSAAATPGFDPWDPAYVPDPESFARKGPPRPGDWLERFPSTGTTFAEYARSRPSGRTAERDQLVLQPIGPFRAEERRLLGTLRELAAAFFACPVTLAPDLPLPDKGRRRRTEAAKPWTQLHTKVILEEVLPPRLPRDAIAYLGITMTDLYPEPSWNFVFGQATFEERVGVYSLARYFPAFEGEEPTPESDRLALLRSYKVLTHETGHMFSLHHCAEYECLMNGTNSLEETDRSVAHLCPVCLKKLAFNLGFDVRARYAALQAIFAREGLTEPAAWIRARLAKIGERR
jgi:archaemetzincin